MYYPYILWSCVMSWIVCPQNLYWNFLCLYFILDSFMVVLKFVKLPFSHVLFNFLQCIFLNQSLGILSFNILYGSFSCLYLTCFIFFLVTWSYKSYSNLYIFTSLNTMLSSKLFLELFLLISFLIFSFSSAHLLTFDQNVNMNFTFLVLDICILL